MNDDFLVQLAKGTSDPAVLDELSRTGSFYVLLAVARNANCGGETLKRLYCDRHFRRLLGKAFMLVLEGAMAGNPNAPARLLEKLSASLSAEVRIRVAGNPSTPLPVMERLLGDFNYYVRKNAAANPSLGAERLAELGRARNAAVRMGVAMNPNTPIPTLERLARDSSEFVSDIAMGRLKRM